MAFLLVWHFVWALFLIQTWKVMRRHERFLVRGILERKCFGDFYLNFLFWKTKKFLEFFSRFFEKIRKICRSRTIFENPKLQTKSRRLWAIHLLESPFSQIERNIFRSRIKPFCQKSWDHFFFRFQKKDTLLKWLILLFWVPAHGNAHLLLLKLQYSNFMSILTVRSIESTKKVEIQLLYLFQKISFNPYNKLSWKQNSLIFSKQIDPFYRSYLI